MDKVELEVAILRSGTTVEKLSEAIGIDRSTLYRKIASGKFYRSEIIRIREELKLSESEMLRIFFDGKVTETQP